METVVLTWTSCHAQDTASRPTSPSTASYDGRSRPCNYSGRGDSIHACQITQNNRSHTSLPSTHNSLPLYTQNLPYSTHNISTSVFVFVFRKETKFVNKILFPKKTKCHIKPWLADRLTMDELRFRIINQVFVWEKEMKKFLMVFGFMNLFHWILNLAFLNLQILFKYPTWRISSIILSENFFSSSSHFKSFLNL